jgi:D-proline reductase (dithiol) PrdB
MPRLSIFDENIQRFLLAQQCLEEPGVPWTQPPADLSKARLALITTAGLHLRGDSGFVTEDATFRVIPGDVEAADLVQTQTSANFDRSAIQQDLNVTFPIDRFRELIAAGQLGSLATNHYSLMGALRNWDRLVAETLPALARRLLDDGVQVVFITPT